VLPSVRRSPVISNVKVRSVKSLGMTSPSISLPSPR
jgi:hypothetical protein